MNNNEQIKLPTGQIGMIMHKGGEYDIKTGKIINGEVLAQREIQNLIVDKASILMSCRLAPGSQTGVNTGTFLADGLQYLAVGVGTLTDPTKDYNASTNPPAATWNLQNPPAPTASAVKLNGEIFRKEFTSWYFVDAGGNQVSTSSYTTATNVLQLVTTFIETEAIGPLTEMGLFGGNASGTKDSGFMFNYKTFPVWNKPSDARLTVTWKLTF